LPRENSSPAAVTAITMALNMNPHFAPRHEREPTDATPMSISMVRRSRSAKLRRF
jgi:hypothetical protein